MSNAPLPTRTLTSSEAESLLAPYLEPGERYLTGGTAKVVTPAGGVKSAHAGQGHLLVTNARLIHWVIDQEGPWLFLPFNEIDRVRRVPDVTVPSGYSQVTVYAHPPAGSFTFFVRRALASSLIEDFDRTESPRAGSQQEPPPQASPRPEGPKRAEPPPVSPQFRVYLPPVPSREHIASYSASLRAIRVLEPATYLNNIVTVKTITDTAQRAADDPRIHAEAERISDPLIEQLRQRWEDGRLPTFNPELIHACLALGTAIARVEHDSGWTRPDTIHPAIHCALTLMGSIGEQEGPGVNVFLDAVFNVARGSAPVTDAFAE